MRVLDANIVIRFLVDEDTDQNRRALAYLSALSTVEESAFLPECVLAEIVFVLGSRHLYARSREETSERLTALLELKGLVQPNKDALIEALRVFASTTLDFPDCVSVGYMRIQSIREIVSFDRDFDRFPDIRRIEP